MPATMSSLRWRPLSAGDVPAWAELLAAAEAVDRTGESYSEDDLAEELEDDTLTQGTWAVYDGVQLVAVGQLHGSARIRDVDNLICFGVVHPAYRRRGIGRQLLQEQVRRAESLHDQRHPDKPARIAVEAGDHVLSAVALARAAGFHAQRHFFDMERDLRTAAPVGTQPAAPLRVVPFTTDRDEEVRRAHNVAFRDHYGSSERDAAVWRQWFTGSRNFRPELSFLVLDGAAEDAAVIGYLLGYYYDAETAVDGYREAWIGQLGTLSGWRGYGIATALLTHALSTYRGAGYEQAALNVDSANATGALGLYERIGFRTVRSSTSWVREIPARPSG